MPFGVQRHSKAFVLLYLKLAGTSYWAIGEHLTSIGKRRPGWIEQILIQSQSLLETDLRTWLKFYSISHFCRSLLPMEIQ